MKPTEWKEEIKKEFYQYRAKLIASSAWRGRVDNGQIVPVNAKLPETEERIKFKQNLRILVVKILARYILLTYEDKKFFDAFSSNNLARALYYNRIEDQNLEHWAFYPFTYGESKEPMPADLQAEIDAIKSLLD